MYQQLPTDIYSKTPDLFEIITTSTLEVPPLPIYRYSSFMLRVVLYISVRVLANMSGTGVQSVEKTPPSVDTEPYSIFPASIRIYLTYLLGVAMIISTLTATIYSPLIPMLSKNFNTSIQAINLTVTVYSVFQGISPGIFASLADSFGRRPVLLGLFTLYSAASLGLALNQTSYAALMALRALQSIGGSATPPIAYGVAADLAPSSERGRLLGPMLSTCNAISATGPIIGGALALATGGSQWVFLALLIIAVMLLFVIGMTLPETARNVVANGSVPARGVWGKPWWLLLASAPKTRKDYEPRQGTISNQSIERSWKPSRLLSSLRIIAHPDAASVLGVIAVSYCIYATLLTVVPTIFDDLYDFNSLQQGCALLPALAGLTFGGIIAGRLIDRNYRKTTEIEKVGDSALSIERARYRNWTPVVLAEVALLVAFGWAVEYHVHPVVPLILEFFVVATSTIMSHTANALLVDIFPNTSSTAYASGQIARCGLSAVSIAVLQLVVDAVGRGWYFTILAIFVGVISCVGIVISRTVGVQWRICRQERKS